MSLMLDVGVSMPAAATIVCLAMFPLILLATWWAMCRLFSPRTALYSLVLAAVAYAFFWQCGVTIAASAVLALTPLVFLMLEGDHRLAAGILLALCLYSHLVLGHLAALALLFYLLHRREKWRGILAALALAYLLYLPWGINVLANLGSFSVSGPGAGGGFALHLLLCGLAAAGLAVCYLRKARYYLLPACFVSMIPIVSFYSSRFWDGYIFLPLALLGGVALDRLHAFLAERLSRRAAGAAYAQALAAGALAGLLVLVLFVDPVIASLEPSGDHAPRAGGEEPVYAIGAGTLPTGGYGVSAPPGNGGHPRPYPESGGGAYPHPAGRPPLFAPPG